MSNQNEPNNEMNRQILEAIDIEVPADDAYAQWTQFESFPHFMDNVEKVEQLGDRRMRWTANILGNEQEWNAEITEQLPGKRIAWRATGGAEHAGVATFHRLSDETSRVTVQIDYSPDGLIESIGDLLGVVSHGVRRDLANFKEFIENRGQPTGEWKGKVASPGDRMTPTQPARLPPTANGSTAKI